jgi:uncharacterized MAPEG superfamily protein
VDDGIDSDRRPADWIYCRSGNRYPHTARIYASQQNAWEAATLFSASVLAALVAGVSVNHMIAPCALFLAFRILHPIAYIKGWSNIRSTASTAGLSCCAWLLVSAAIAA